MEGIIQKINFSENENYIFSFFEFRNVNLSFTFRFFERWNLISIWISIKIETKFKFMEVDCEVKELFLDCYIFVLYYVRFYISAS